MQDRHDYKCIYILATSYMTFMTLSAVLGSKLIATPYGVLSAASLVSPLWFIVGDMITEVYGIKIVMKLFWSVIVCQFIFASACLLIIKLPSPPDWHGQSAYELVCGHLLKYAVFQLIGIIIAWQLNASLLNKWKILLRGKYFWLRSIGASGIGMIVFSITSVFPSIYGQFPLQEVVTVVTWSCVLKISFTVFLSGFSNLIVNILKNLEGVDEYAQSISYNPFNNA